MHSILIKILSITVLFQMHVIAQQGIVKVNIDDNISHLLDIKKKVNSSLGVIKIQIFSGSRIKAEELLQKFKYDFPKHSAQMIYESPNYKIWFGEFINQIQADRELKIVRKKYKEAFSFKPKPRIYF